MSVKTVTIFLVVIMFSCFASEREFQQELLTDYKASGIGIFYAYLCQAYYENGGLATKHLIEHLNSYDKKYMCYTKYDLNIGRIEIYNFKFDNNIISGIKKAFYSGRKEVFFNYEDNKLISLFADTSSNVKLFLTFSNDNKSISLRYDYTHPKGCFHKTTYGNYQFEYDINQKIIKEYFDFKFTYNSNQIHFKTGENVYTYNTLGLKTNEKCSVTYIEIWLHYVNDTISDTTSIDTIPGTIEIIYTYNNDNNIIEKICLNKGYSNHSYSYKSEFQYYPNGLVKSEACYRIDDTALVPERRYDLFYHATGEIEYIEHYAWNTNDSAFCHRYTYTFLYETTINQNKKTVTPHNATFKYYGSNNFVVNMNSHVKKATSIKLFDTKGKTIHTRIVENRGTILFGRIHNMNSASQVIFYQIKNGNSFYKGSFIYK